MTGQADQKDGGDRPGDQKLKVMTSEADLAPAHLEDLASSCIPEAHARRAGIYSTNCAKVVAKALKWSWRDGGGMMLPFHDYDSRKVLLTRVKPDNPRTRPKGNGTLRTVKYEQAPNTGAVPYFGPGTIDESRLGNKSKPLIWAEGEKKTLLLDILGYPVIGLTGCHNFNDSKKNHAGEGMVWAPALTKYANRFFAGRGHIICFDADSIFNDNVLLAMRRLAGLLLQNEATWVRFVRIPRDTEDPNKGVGIDDFMFAHGEAATRALIDEAEPIEFGGDIEPLAPKDPLVQLSSLKWLRGAKLDNSLRLPPSYDIRRDRSVWLEPPLDKPDSPSTEVMKGVVIPTRMLESGDGEEQRFEIAYYSAGKWRFAMVDRRTLKGARQALEGLPAAVMIDSNNAADAVRWFSNFLHTNSHRMKVRRYISECGWQWDGDDPVFLLNEPVTRVGKQSHIVADTSGERTDALDALKPAGNLEAHKSALKRFFETDELSAIMYLAALAAPLLQPLGAPNFAVHLYGESTTGKSTRQKCAAGIYGDPGNGSWVGSWNTTNTAMEARAAKLNHLPLYFDEVGSGDPKAIEKSMYMLVNGEGKSRSNRSLESVRPLSFRNVTCSNGEHELTSAAANTGVQVRVVQIRSKPFVGMERADIDAMRADCDAHHGQLGRAWIQRLVDIEDWGSMKETFADAKELFDGDSKSGLMQRQAVYFALMAIAEDLSHDWFGIGKAGGGTVRDFVSNDSGRNEIASASDRAIDSLASWVYSETLSFPHIVYSNGSKVTRTTKGVKLINGARDAKHILFVPCELKKRFEEEGISFAEVMSGWREKGWIKCDTKKMTSRVRLDGAQTRFIVVKREVLGIDDQRIDETQTDADYGD